MQRLLTKKRMRKTLILYCILNYFCLSPLTAQYKNLIDSLNQHKPVERARIMLGYIEEKKINDKEFYSFMEIMEEYAHKKKDDLLLSEIEYFLLKNERVHKNPEKDKIKNFNKLLKYYQEKNEPLFVGHCLHEIAQEQFQNQQYGHSFENSFRAHQIFKKIGYENVPTIGKFLHDLALNHYFFRDYNEVIQLMRISISLPPYSPNLDMQRYNNIGMAYGRLEINDSAKYYLNKAYDASLKYNSEVWQGISTGNIGEIYYQQKNYPDALKYFQKQFKLEGNDLIRTVKVTSLVNLSKAYIELDSISQAKFYLDKFEEALKTLKPQYLGDRQQIEVLNGLHYRTKSDYLKKIGDYKNAWLYRDSLIETQKYFDNKYNSAHIKITADKLLIKDKELNLIKEKERRLNQSIYYIVAIFALILFGGATFIWLFISKLKKQRENQILQSQNQIAQLEKEQIQFELNAAKKELRNFITKINEQNVLVEKISTDLALLKNTESSNPPLIDKTIDELKHVKILTDDDWLEFQHNFEKVFPELMLALKNHTPSITTSEMRYLMLIQLNLSHKEMANALGVSTDTIRVTWNRVRKKLNGTLQDTPQILIKKLLESKNILA